MNFPGAPEMTFQNPPESEIERLLRTARTIAVVGLADDPARPSYGVARALQQFGYRILPVNPREKAVLGEPAYPDLTAAHAALAPGEAIDIVDVFRRPEHLDAIVEECLRLGLKALWIQEGIVNEAAAGRARAAGMFVVMDRCLYKTRRKMIAGES
jgi:predicted CoA-binding protein